ncbi:MAG: peptidoglycan bridge formation glycyltransferase FemA/FemB family protein [Armatimonadetes bacterium]|nr:peptidoglycan bridge formation glycyltransferase FemA/FemB family protein [Armatimonadota bacterium]
MPSPVEFRVLDASRREAWDRFAAAHPNTEFEQAWAWGEVKGRGEWRPARVAVCHGDDIVAGAQLLLRPLPLGSTLIYAARGPLADLDDGGDQAAWEALEAGLRQFCREHRAIALKLDPCVEAGRDRRLHELRGAVAVGGEGFGGTQPKWVMRLDLTPGLDAVFGAFEPDYRNRIRKAGRRGVTVRAAESDADWLAFDRLLRETAARQHFSVRAQSYFDAMRAELTGACEVRVFLAEREGRAVGGILCVAFGQTVWYLYGGMNDEGREHYSGYLLQWEAIQWCAARGGTVYDFRGVAPPTATEHPTYGLNRFKAGFNPRLVEWTGEYDVVFRPLPYRLFTTLLPRVKAWLKRRR